MNDPVPFQIHNDFSFPMASSVRFKYPAKGTRPAVDLCWYDGGMRPPTPPELLDSASKLELQPEGMMFVGDQGKILAGFHIDNPQIISGTHVEKAQEPGPKTPPVNQVARSAAALQLFADAVRSGKQFPGNFREAEHITEAINLYSVALRTGQLLKYDAASRTITNNTDANKYLSRDYRPGWDPASI